MKDSAQISQIQSLQNGRGLQYIIDEVYNILGKPLLLHNMEYELIACAQDAVTDDALWNEIVETGVFSEETIKFFSQECFIDTVAGTQSIAILISGKLKYQRIYGRVFNKYDNTVADLIMVAHQPIDEQDVAAFKCVCGKISEEIKACSFFNKYGVIYHERLIRELLDTGIDDRLIYSDHVANLYEGLKANIYVVVAAVDNDAEQYRDLFKEMQPEFKYAVYSNYVVMIASSEQDVLDIEKESRALSGYLKDNDILTGASSRFDNLFNLRKHYNQAVELLLKHPVNI